ncbi:MAG: sugar transferase [Candidatus Komeilibacteria bacterium]|nr:sugar transferase [Candidatus Komeilibacteria bacterium]
MKKFELIFTALLVPLDYLVLLAAAVLSYFLRVETFVTDLRPVFFNMSLQQYLQAVYPLLVGWIIIFALAGLYSFKRLKLWEELKYIFLATSTASLAIIVAFFFNSQLFSSRFIILAFWVVAFILISLERIITHYIKKLFYRQGYGVRRVIVIGQDDNTFSLIAQLKKYPTYGFRVIEHLPEFTAKEAEYIGKLRNKVIVDEIIQADVSLPIAQKDELFNYCQENQLGFKFVASMLETKLTNFDINTLTGVPVIEIRHTRLEGWGRILKRIFDVIFSLAVCIILIPVSALIGLIIKLDSAGPIFVKLTRIGMGGRKFTLYKYRSMVANAHEQKSSILTHNERLDGPLFKMKNDPRITRVGHWLRRLSIDELPQFFNVLRGDMSVVGPRPHEPEEVDRYQRQQRKLLNIKPGISGQAQVSGRSNLPFVEEVRLDSYYIENWSFWLDIQIVLKTIAVVILRRDVA